MSPRSIEHDHKSASPLCDRGRARYHAPRHTPRHLWNHAHKLFVGIKLCQNKLFFRKRLPNKSHMDMQLPTFFNTFLKARARRAAAGGARAAPRARAERSGARGARTKKIRAYTIVRTCTCTHATCYYGLIAYESRATPRRSRLFMGSPGRMCQRCAHTHHADADGTHPGRRATRTPRPTYPFWASCGGPLPRRTVAAASCSRLWPGLSAQTRPKTRRPCSSSGQSAARSTCHPSWGRTW